MVRVVVRIAALIAIGLFAWAEIWYSDRVYSANAVCRRYHFDREGSDGAVCVVQGPDTADGKHAYFVVPTTKARDYAVMAILTREDKASARP